MSLEKRGEGDAGKGRAEGALGMVYVELPLILGTDTQERGKARPSPPV